MAKLILKQMDRKDKKQICKWDRYKGKFIDGYERFTKFLSGTGGVSTYLKNMDKINYKSNGACQTFSYVLKENGKVKSFVYFLIEKEENKLDTMYIQGIATHPKEQGKGYASKMVKMLLKNSEKYMNGCKPCFVTATVDQNNIRSRKIFEKLGGKLTFKSDFMFDDIRVDLRETSQRYNKQEETREKGK